MAGSAAAASSPRAVRVAAWRRWRRVKIGAIMGARVAEGRFLSDSGPRGTPMTPWQRLRARGAARFELEDARLDEIRAEVEANGKSHPRFEVVVKDEGGDVVARVGKVLSVRKKRA